MEVPPHAIVVFDVVEVFPSTARRREVSTMHSTCVSSHAKEQSEKLTRQVTMRAFTSARYTVDVGHHSYPMDKYRLVPERLLAEAVLLPEDHLEPEAATLDDVLRVHTPEYVHAFVNGALER